MTKKLIFTIFLVIFFAAGCTYHQTFENPPPPVDPPESVEPLESVEPAPAVEVKPEPPVSGGPTHSINPPSNYDTPGTGGGAALETY
ncbi:hypothetical protein DO021_21120 [Desulfobacter hydrogenophilus]|uniref:Uncharacterized protein n=1 Tax=Desulfobacter hydrogenophilus TaxID=2291 RepID=A0A328F6Q3_9BACT|nr:hypothetical protein [Desulfobacter hydrogenophilus]NDY71399.1 hypothetical protein [Desulfobacter hydrogenophilus]QBH12139.1 hypothetical protein EYB58_03870 [Desulfobacter hydrogenophilus]RAM00049.1 hypothetical protein DO021_21120 [Desulfobacter hydrogenophilus]